jgi:predicted 2-oxoglutarate/Fe(II)-dependent dioxygenase YbiX
MELKLNESAEIKILSDFGIHIQNLISKEEISYILNSKKNIKGEQARIGIRQPVDPSIKEQQDLYQYIDNIMLQAADLYINQFNKNENKYKHSKKLYHITTWDLGSQIGIHNDVINYPNDELKGLAGSPKISILLYLSDDFEGGEIVFQSEKEIAIKPSAGDAIVFNSEKMHYVNKLISGSRIVVDLFLIDF